MSKSQSIFKETKTGTNKKNKQRKKARRKKKKCVYNINNNCVKTESGKCDPSCKLYSPVKNKPMELSCEIKKTNIILKLCVPVKQHDFVEYGDTYVLRCNQSSPVKISFYLNIRNNPEDDVLTNFKMNSHVVYKNDSMSITIPKVRAIENIQSMPYNKIKNIIRINYNHQTEYGNLCIHMDIPKKQLFDLIKVSAARKNVPQNTAGQKSRRIAPGTIHSQNMAKLVNRDDIEAFHNIHIPESVTAIVLSDTRKCTESGHPVIDTKAKLRIALFSGNIFEYEVPAAYCAACDTFYILKNDYKAAKKRGVILCQIEDKTHDYVANHKGRSWSGNESRIHQLGYNVQKNNGYTQKQRQLILAYIIENTSITKHEIRSVIIRCINQHNRQDRYAQAVSCWRSDLEFVDKYQLGDIPQVKIKGLVIKGSKV